MKDNFVSIDAKVIGLVPPADIEGILALRSLVTNWDIGKVLLQGHESHHLVEHFFTLLDFKLHILQTI